MFRSGSRKANVHSHFTEHGEDSAVKFGVSLGLAAGTVRSWVRSWAKGQVAKPRTGKAPPVGAKRVHDKHIPSVLGTVVREGPEVSEVKWDDGRLQYVTNEFLKPVEKRNG